MKMSSTVKLNTGKQSEAMDKKAEKDKQENKDMWGGKVNAIKL